MGREAVASDRWPVKNKKVAGGSEAVVDFLNFPTKN
jgi:hypothetical protein